MWCNHCQKDTSHWQNFVSNRDPANWTGYCFNPNISYHCRECGSIYSGKKRFKDVRNDNLEKDKHECV